MHGSSFGGVKGRDQVPQLVQRYLDGDIDVDPFVSHQHQRSTRSTAASTSCTPRTGSGA